MNKQEKTKRKDIAYGAMSHIKSLIVAIRRFKNGSQVEKDYAFEHYEKLKYYLDRF